MNRVNIGLIGFGNVGSGVIKFLQNKKSEIRDKYDAEFVVQKVCDIKIQERATKLPDKIGLTTDYHEILNDPEIEVVIELIGGLHPAKEIALGALEKGKHLVTANKSLIAHHGKELFEAAHRFNRNIYFETSVMAGVPVLKSITEGVAGNSFKGLYGIINGTCNYILSAMTKKSYTFAQAVEEAQKLGFAETDPTLDVNGTDSANKLAILVFLAFGKFIDPKDIHTEGITHISHEDIQYASDLGLTIKLLAIAKKVNNEIEARVHPTLITKEHPLASINGIFNALSMDTDPLGDLLISGEGAGQMTAASGVISDLINLSARKGCPTSSMLGNICQEDPALRIRAIDDISTKFYIRFMATDKPGTLSAIAGVLGDHGISINSVHQKAHSPITAVPVIMLTDYAPEKMVRLALDKIHKLGIVRNKPVAIRMENLKLIFK